MRLLFQNKLEIFIQTLKLATVSVTGVAFTRGLRCKAVRHVSLSLPIFSWEATKIFGGLVATRLLQHGSKKGRPLKEGFRRVLVF